MSERDDKFNTSVVEHIQVSINELLNKINGNFVHDIRIVEKRLQAK